MEEIFARQLTDTQYFDASELGFFITSMLDQVAVQKPDDAMEFCRLFFQRVNSMQHVIGADFSYMIDCNHNRRSFVHCCQDMFKNVSPGTDFKVSDMHKLYCLVCPDLSAAVVQEAALYISPTKMNPTHYSYGDLQISFFFQIVFYEWLKIVSPVFHNEETRKPLLLKADGVANTIQDLVGDNVDLQFHLPMNSIAEVIQGVVAAGSARGGDVSFKNIVRALVMSPSIRFFLLSKSRK